jgi:hypothetical protein
MKKIFLLLFTCIIGYYCNAQQTYTASGSWTCPAGITSIAVECWGGGGSGGGATGNPAGGGGGSAGAYVKNNAITVTPGTTYTVTVGSGGIGSTSAGVAGGSSWFNTSTTIMAVGGKGGALASSNSSSAAGAAAVITGNVGGTTIYYGGAGGTGSTGATAGGGGSSAGTGSNGNAGGVTTGGTAVTGGGAGGNGGLVGSSGGNGNPGIQPGGAGGGGRAGNSTDRSGGAGAAGKVVLNYSCPTYTLGSTSAYSPVISGATTTVTLTSTAAGLPVGKYVVTYSLSGANVATGLTANIIVTTAGTGSFITSALANEGATTITINNLASGSTGMCSNAISSNNSSVVAVNTYCTPSGNQTCSSNDYIKNVTFNTINNSTTCATGGYTHFAASGSTTTSVLQGTSYTLSFSVGSGSGTHGAGVWVDFNQDGDFADDGEFFLIGNSINQNSTTTVSIVIPETALLGLTRMRIRYADGITVTSAMSCIMDGSYGETEDYDITINACTPVSAPSAATYSSPGNGATAQSVCSTVLSWNAPSFTGCNGPASYDVYLGTTNPPITLVANVTGTQYSQPLQDLATYYWKVVPKNSAGSATSCPVWSFTSGSADNPYYCYSGDAKDYSKTAGDNCGIMTTNAQYQHGSVWNRSPISFASSFDHTLSMYFGSNNNGADGCAFVFQNSPLGLSEVGDVGRQLGAGGILNSLIIEFDTYDNDNPTHLVDRVYNHTAIEIDGDLSNRPPFSGPVAALPGNAYLDDGNVHIIRVQWDVDSKTFSVYIDGSLRLTSTYDFVNNVFHGNPNVYWGFTGSTGLYYNEQYFCPGDMPLPVELLNFDASCNEGKHKLEWSTATETNNNYFTIERSSDAIHFEKAGQISGAGNSNIKLQYSWTEENILEGTYYYRLTQTDFDGKHETFNPVSVNCEGSEKSLNIMNLLPNDNTLHLEFESSQNGNHTISITDCLGKTLQTVHKDCYVGKNYADFVIPGFKKGVYLISVSNSLNRDVRKFVNY